MKTSTEYKVWEKVYFKLKYKMFKNDHKAIHDAVIVNASVNIEAQVSPVVTLQLWWNAWERLTNEKEQT